MPSPMSMSATANSIGQPDRRRNDDIEADDQHADDDHRDRVAEPPERADQGRIQEALAAVQDRGHRDDVVRVGRVAHAEQESESGKGEQLRHPILHGGSYCNCLQ